MSLRRNFALVLLGALVLAPCLGVCAGWSAAGDTRMACCADKSANEARMCCASAEGRQNAESTAHIASVALPPVEPVALKLATALAPQLRAASAIDSHDPVTDNSARYVLLSVFLL